jgi:hypothetical protein
MSHAVITLRCCVLQSFRCWTNTAVAIFVSRKPIVHIPYGPRKLTKMAGQDTEGGVGPLKSKLPELHLNIHSVPRSKHYPPLSYKPIS